MLQDWELSGLMISMSHFGTALKETLERKQMKARRLAELSGVSTSMVSRFITGDRVWVSPEFLGKLVAAVSDDPVERAELLRARLLDEMPLDANQLLEIRVRGAEEMLREKGPSYRIALPKSLEEDFETLREWVIQDRNVREIIEGLANLMRSGDCRTREEVDPVVEEREREIFEKAKAKVISSSAGAVPATKYPEISGHMRGSAMHESPASGPSSGTASESIPAVAGATPRTQGKSKSRGGKK